MGPPVAVLCRAEAQVRALVVGDDPVAVGWLTRSQPVGGPALREVMGADGRSALGRRYISEVLAADSSEPTRSNLSALALR